MSSSREGDSVRYVGGSPLPSMSAAIAELRKQGHDALADELTRIKEQWARKVMHYAQCRDAAAASKVHRARSNVVPLRQKPGSRARAGVEIPRGNGERA